MREKNEENAPSTKYVFVASECYEEFPFVCMGLGMSMGMQWISELCVPACQTGEFKCVTMCGKYAQ